MAFEMFQACATFTTFWTGSPKSPNLRDTQNSIAFGSAPRREADSQPISQFVRQAVSQTLSRASRQADRNTQLGFFFSVATRLEAVG